MHTVRGRGEAFRSGGNQEVHAGNKGLDGVGGHKTPQGIYI